MFYNIYVKTMSKIVLRTAIYSFIGTVAVFCYGLGIFSMCFPRSMADFYDSVGNTRLSAMYYGRIYERNKTNENLYFALSKNILAHSDSATIKYGDKWFALDEIVQKNLTEQVDAYLINDALDEHEKDILTMYNTDFVLRRGYIVALINKGQTTKAKDFLNSCPEEVQEKLRDSLTKELGEP